MDPKRHISYSRLALLFAAITVILSIASMLEWTLFAGMTGERAAEVDLSARFQHTDVQLPASTTPEAFASIVSKNLFDRNRGAKQASSQQVQQQPPQAPAPPSIPELHAQLIAVILSPDASIALVEVAQGQPAVRLTIGQEINGWRLKTIAKDRAEFINGTTTKLLLLRDSLRKEGSAGTTSPLSCRSGSSDTPFLCQS